ncbi:cytochrome c3 family protein [Planctomycetota bacterium]
MLRKVSLLCVGLIVVVLVVVAQGAITGSSHDFSTSSWNFTGEICAPCHTPHNAEMDVAGSPLWSHQVTTATFQLYSSPSFDGESTIGQPSGTSKLCLSCHDGTVALDNFGGFVGGSNYAFLTLGTDLSGSHPISFTYDTALAETDKGLFNPVTTSSGLGGTIHVDLLHEGNVECTSCHNVHNESGADSLLVKSNDGSQLCLTCHNK